MIKVKKISLMGLVLFFMFIFVGYKYCQSVEVTINNIDTMVIFTFFIILILSLINIIRDDRPYSLNKTYWYFNLIFFFMAPMAQYLSNYNMWGKSISSDTYIIANVLIIIGNIIHTMLYKSNHEVKFNENESKQTLNSFMIFGIAIIAFILLIMNVGFSNLFLRASNVSEFSESKMFNTIISCFLKAVPVYCFSLIYEKEKRLNFKTIAIVIIVFLMNYPVSTTRFWMGAIYIGIVLKVVVKNTKQNRLQDIMLVAIFTIIFPISYYFHFYSLEYVLQNKTVDFNLAESYLTVDYDAYSIFARIIEYVSTNGVVLGKQLIGSILFFIPRAIWPSKPSATGAFIASETNQSFTNISSPFISEGYINFGVVGLIVFEIVLSLVCRVMDNAYWSEKKNKYLVAVYPYCIGLLIFYERGALHHAVVYTFCFILPLLVLFIKDKFTERKV